ncbi:MAG: N-acetylmuramoyl-L-alanine amidase [Bacteroidaceae bacterium]
MINQIQKMKWYVIGLLFLLPFQLVAQDLSGVKIFVNPGHGGFDSDDRNITIPPFSQGDPNGFWESQSNFDKGIQLRELLQNAGATVVMSRNSNAPTTDTYSDDTPLTQIVAMANASNADYMLSIHSNAGAGTANHVLQLYAGVDPDDTNTYYTATPYSDEGRAVSTIIANNLYSNQTSVWTSSISVHGDKTFARTAMGWSNGYGVLRGLQVPGCISEGSMHDYIPETYRLMNMDYKWLEAWHFFKSFCDYFEAGDITSGNIAGTIHDSRLKNLSNYYKKAGSRDELLPLTGATVTVQPGNLTYTTDELFNGFYLFKALEPGTYTMTFEKDGYLAQTQSVEVKENETTYFNALLSLERSDPPEVISYSPNVAIDEPVTCATPLVFEFNYDVDVVSAENAFSISPDVEGVISFEDSQHRMIFTPTKPYEVSTIYTVTLDKSLQHPGNISMTDDFTFQFLSGDRNELLFLAQSPAPNSALYYASPNFEYRFDKELNTLNVRDAIKVYDAEGNELAKNARSIKSNKVAEPYGSTAFTLLKPLVPGATYQVTMDKGVVDIDGIGVFEPISYTFTASTILESDKPVLEDFESADGFAYDSSASSLVKSASVSKTSKKLSGSYACSFAYSFEQAGAKVTYTTTTPAVQVMRDKVIGLHIFGDLSGNTLMLQLTGSNQDVQWVSFTDLDFLGWGFRELQLSQLPAGVTYTLTGIQLVQSGVAIQLAGAFYLDDLLIYDSPLSSIEDLATHAIQVTPNPATNSIQVNGAAAVEQLSLYSLNGTLIRSVSAQTRMDVGDLSRGSYVLRIVLPTTTLSTVVLLIP